MLSKKQLKMFENFQFFDKYRKFPSDKKKVTITLSMSNFIKLKEKENVSGFIDKLVEKNI